MDSLINRMHQASVSALTGDILREVFETHSGPIYEVSVHDWEKHREWPSLIFKMDFLCK